MAITGWSTSNYLKHAAAVMANYPIVITAWRLTPTGSTHQGQTVQLGASDTSQDHTKAQLNFISTRAVRSFVRSTTNANATTTAVASVDTWHLHTGEFLSTASRGALINGANRVTNGSGVAPNAPSVTMIGFAGTEAAPADNDIAEVCFWNPGSMTQAERDSLYVKIDAGESPMAIDAETGQPWTGALVDYWRLRDTTLAERTGLKAGIVFDIVGTLSNSSTHPTVDDPPGGAPTSLLVPRRALYPTHIVR